MQQNNQELPQRSLQNNVEGFVIANTSKLHKQLSQNSMEDVGNDMGSVDPDEVDAITTLA